ncbi:MAG TPA: SCO family protein [Tepidisphaeraceae bacterium]|nr:SCO family protein [Tepidisphaeraceae bacterium]
MTRTQKILTSILWGLLVLVMVSVIGAGWWKRQPEYSATGTLQIETIDGPKRGDVLFEVPPFALTDQNNQPVTDQTLRGKPWVAAFIFTQCAGPCPMMSSNMAKLQQRVPHPDLKLVSFTVDPQRDTPQVLKQYAQNLQADESRWSFLTGSEQEMADVARGMLLPFSPATESADITHSTKFLLVDGEGNVRGVYSPDEMDALAADSAKLVGAVPATPAPQTASAEDR